MFDVIGRGDRLIGFTKPTHASDPADRQQAVRGAPPQRDRAAQPD